MSNKRPIPSSVNNRDELLEAKHCGCYYCEKEFDVKMIKVWTDDGFTAVCPYCHVDSVIPLPASKTNSKKLLHNLYKEYFTKKV